MSNDQVTYASDEKPWWQSRAIVGALVVVFAQVASLFGLVVDEPAATEAAFGLVTLVGAGLAWWGRVKATKPISRTKVLPGVNIGQSKAQEMARH